MKKIGLLVLAVVLALGALGTGYALWSENLYIQGTVETGELDADWVITGYGDSESPNKDVSWVEAYVDGKYLYVTIYNAYPCIDYYVYCDIYNSGTIPLHVCGLNLIGMNIVDASFGLYVPGIPTPFQIHPNESLPFGFQLHLGNGAAQGATYTFTFEYVVVQYNEDCPAVDFPFDW